MNCIRKLCATLEALILFPSIVINSGNTTVGGIWRGPVAQAPSRRRRFHAEVSSGNSKGHWSLGAGRLEVAVRYDIRMSFRVNLHVRNEAPQFV